MLLVFLFAPNSVLAHGLRWFTQPDGTAGSTTPYGDNNLAGHRVRSVDAEIYYEVYGTGRPLLVLHGGTVGSPYEMGDLLDHLRDRFQLIVLSTRGHGKSSMGYAPVSLEQRAADALAVLDAVTSSPVSVLGFSDGAYSAFSLAVSHPERVERIAAIGAGTLKAGFFPQRLTLEDLEKADPAYVAQMRRLSPEPERLQDFLDASMNFWHRASIGQETFANIRCPVLLLAGDEDDHAPVATVLEAHQLIPNSRLCIVPKAWHTAFLDNFDVTWTAIEQFLTDDLANLTPSRKVAANQHVFEERPLNEGR